MNCRQFFSSWGRLASAVSMVLLLGLFGCTEQGTQVETPSGITVVNGAGATIPAAGSISLSVRVTSDGGRPAGGAAVKWRVVEGSGSLSDSESVTDENGLARITWTSDGTAGTVRVEADVPGVGPLMIGFEVDSGVPVALDLSRTAVEFRAIGETLSIDAAVVDRYGNDIGVEVEWSSSDPHVVSIRENGMIRAESSGEADIHVRFGFFHGRVPVSVRPLAADLSVSPSSHMFIALGERLDVALQGIDAGGSHFQVADGDAQWFSDDEAVASVSAEGVVIAKASGATTIHVHVQGVSAQLEIEVQPEVARLILSPRTLQLSSLGAIQQLDVESVDENGHTIRGEGHVYAWGSNDHGVVIVEDGAVTAVGNGEARIEVSFNGVSASIAVVVKQEVAQIAVSDLALRALGASRLVSVDVHDARGNHVDWLLPSDITWKSSDPDIFAVSGGQVTAVGVGSATLTVSAGQGSATASISVIQRPVYIQVDPGTIAFNALEGTEKVTATAFDANHHEIPGADTDFAWKSSDPTVASVTSAGTVVAEGVGEATITVTRGSDASVQVPVAVSQPPEIPEIVLWESMNFGGTQIHDYYSNHHLGFEFVPSRSIEVTALRGWLTGNSDVRVYDVATSTIIASSNVPGTGSWETVALSSPLVLEAGRTYEIFVAANAYTPVFTPIGNSRRLPLSNDDLTITRGCLANSAYDRPCEQHTFDSHMFGLVDFIYRVQP